MLFDLIQQDLHKAQLARDSVTTETLRMLLSEVKNAQIAKGESLSDEETITVIQKEIKKRREAAEGFRSGEREEQALKEEDEAKVLQKYLPEQLSEEDLEQIINQVIAEVGATSMSDMGKVIGIVRGKVGASAEPARISSLIKAKLS